MTSTTISPASAATLRLTRRGRTLLLLALVAVMFGAFSFGQASSQASGTRVAGSPAAPVVAETVVLPGESLWTVARRIAPENDPRDVVEQIRQLNDMRGSQLLIGQQLLLPVAA